MTRITGILNEDQRKFMIIFRWVLRTRNSSASLRRKSTQIFYFD